MKKMLVIQFRVGESESVVDEIEIDLSRPKTIEAILSIIRTFLTDRD